MTTSLDEQFTPHLDEEQLTAIQEAAPPLLTKNGLLKVDKLPATDVYSKRDATLEKAIHKYATLLRSTVYPYGVDPYTKEPIKPPKGIPSLLWNRAYKKVYFKHHGSKPTVIPSKPKFNTLRLKGTYTGGTGLIARGISARGGSIIGTVAGLAAPLIISGISGLVKLIRKAVKKHKKKNTQIESPESTQDVAAVQGSGETPTPYQVEQAQLHAKKAAHSGVVGFPNPLSFPPYPAPLMDPNVPIDALTFWREVYNKVKRGLITLASALHAPPKYAMPYIGRFIRAHAKATFGKGTAKLLLNTNLQGKPMKVITPFKLIYPMLERRARNPMERDRLYRLLHKKPLTSAIRGEGLHELLANLSAFISPSEEPPMMPISPVMPIAHPECHISCYIVKALRLPQELTPELTKALYSGETSSSDIMDTNDSDIADTSDEEPSEGSSGTGKRMAACGSGVWDVIKNIALTIGEVGAPILGAILGKKFGNSKGMTKAFEVAGQVAGEALGETRRISQVQAAEKESMKELDKKKKELEDAAALTPELYTRLKREAEIGKLLADQLQHKTSFELPSDMGTMKKWKTSSYKPSTDYGDLIASQKKKMKDIYNAYANYEAVDKRKAKKKKAKAIDKYMKKYNIGHSEAKKRVKAKLKGYKSPKYGKQAKPTKTPYVPLEPKATQSSEPAYSLENILALEPKPMSKPIGSGRGTIRYKPITDMTLSIGPTTDASIRGRQRAGQVLMLAKKMT